MASIDLDSHVKQQYVAQAPASIVRYAESRSHKPLSLRGRISIDINNSELPSNQQSAMLDSLTSRPDKHRRSFDTALVRSFEYAILSGDIDKTHDFIVALYTENQEKNWPTHSLFEFLDVVRKDLDRVEGVAFTYSKERIRVSVTNYLSTPDSSNELNCVLISSDVLGWASALRGTESNESPRETFTELSKVAMRKYENQERASIP